MSCCCARQSLTEIKPATWGCSSLRRQPQRAGTKLSTAPFSSWQQFTGYTEGRINTGCTSPPCVHMNIVCSPQHQIPSHLEKRNDNIFASLSQTDCPGLNASRYFYRWDMASRYCTVNTRLPFHVCTVIHDIAAITATTTQHSSFIWSLVIFKSTGGKKHTATKRIKEIWQTVNVFPANQLYLKCWLDTKINIKEQHRLSCNYVTYLQGQLRTLCRVSHIVGGKDKTEFNLTKPCWHNRYQNKRSCSFKYDSSKK